MQVDHVPYIFGSFARRRQSQEMNKSKRLSLSHFISPNTSSSRKSSMDGIQRVRTLSKPFLEFFHPPKKEEIIIEENLYPRKSAIRLALEDESPIFEKVATFPRVSKKGVNAYRGSLRTTFKEIFEKPAVSKVKLEENEDFICFWCKKVYNVPRVLTCLHTFCTKCLFEIENQNYYYADPRNSVCSEAYYDQRTSAINKSITCPICNTSQYLPRDGIEGLPHNYILQHRLLLATINSENTKLLCDICSIENPAIQRCTTCLINLCPVCSEIHANSPKTEDHELLGLKDKGITKIKRQIMCFRHPDKELSLYCSNCNEVCCDECKVTLHAYHSSEDARKACSARNVDLKDALERAKSYTDRAEKINNKIKISKEIWASQCDKVEEQIEKFIEEYKKNIDEHKKNLLQRVKEVRDEQIEILKQHENKLEININTSKHTIKFTKEILQEGTEIEILTFLDKIQRKLQFLTCSEDDLIEPKITENVQFLENEMKDGAVKNLSLYGVVSTQKVSLEHCVVHKEGASFDNLRIYKQVTIILQTRDVADSPLNHGGLDVKVELWYRDPGITRALEVNVQDRKDGCYTIIFTPDAPGRLWLAVMIDGQHIKNSPFPIRVRTVRPHRGVYHCCSFCSGSVGECGCGGRMVGLQGGGCGHGHQGHPGRRHWSCCGNVLHNSECRRQSIVADTFK